MVVFGEVILSKIIEKVVELGFDYLITGCSQSGGIKDELRCLEIALPRIKAVVEAAESAPEQITNYPSLKLWLQQLKYAIYKADDVIDDLEYLRLQQQSLLLSEEASSQNRVCSIVTSHFSKRVKYDPILKKLSAAIKNLNEVASNMGDFLTILGANRYREEAQCKEAQIISDRETGPLLTESIVLGRDKEQERLLQWLKEDPLKQGQEQEGSNHNNVSLFSIVGHGGMGKTTLAQLVFNDQSIQSYFSPKIWVCVSTSSDVKGLTANMIESATGVTTAVNTIAALQKALKNKLSSQKFLLVLPGTTFLTGKHCLLL